MKLPARVQGRRLALAFEGEFADRFWPGVNLGVTVPGRHPGELPATRADYDRWLDGMQDLGARVVRVYTILRPAFYEALAAHNERNPRTPLYFIQGVWIPEERFIAERDAYPTSEEFDREISDAVAVVHGDADLPERPGHASGRYRTDVSRWLLAWSPGVEWDPYATRNTDRVHAGAPPHRGRYIRSSADATPMESWIAARLDHLATLEAERGWSRPVTFTNWLTTDPLEHPEEPMRKEDMVSVDAAHLRATSRWPGGFFASYHAYPYYPDFLRLQPGYRDAKDPYEAYLKDLKAHHGDQAVMITEFGVPTGIGSAHYGPLGRDQGGHSEQEAGRDGRRHAARDPAPGHGRRGALLLRGRVVQADLEHDGHGAAGGAPAAVAERAHQRGAVRHPRGRARQDREGAGRRRRRGVDARALAADLRGRRDRQGGPRHPRRRLALPADPARRRHARPGRLRRPARRQPGPSRTARRRARGRRVGDARPGSRGGPARGGVDGPDRLPVRPRAPVREGGRGRPRAGQRRVGAPAPHAQPPLHRPRHGREAGRRRRSTSARCAGAPRTRRTRTSTAA